MAKKNAKTPAERQRERRNKIRSDHVMVEHYKTKRKEEWRRHHAKKSVNESARAKQGKRKMWREAKRAERSRKMSQLRNSIELNTSIEIETIQVMTDNVGLLPVNESTQNVESTQKVESTRKVRGRKQVFIFENNFENYLFS